jgi:hypothetical protein
LSEFALTALSELVRKKKLFNRAQLKIHFREGGFHDGERRGAIEQQAGCCNIRFKPRHCE